MRQVHGFEPIDSEQDEYWPYIRNLVGSVVLIEAIVSNRDDRFKIEEFTQRLVNVPESQLQAPWLETYLTADGSERLIDERRFVKVPSESNLRMAFFMHFWDPAVPLSTTYGLVKCPPPTAMPGRLEVLAPYEAP
jgi:hypothetical protein